jgi:hypothetical protein
MDGRPGTGTHTERTAAMVAGAAATVLDLMAVRPDKVALLKDVPTGNGNWLVEMSDGQRVVLWRYHAACSTGDSGDCQAVRRIGVSAV